MENAGDTAVDEQPKDSPIRKITLRILSVAVVFFLWSVISDRYTPYTTEARVRGYVVPIAPQVAGEIVEINVSDNEIVEDGHILLKLDPTQYQLAVNKAQADLENAGQDLGAGMASVTAAETGLANARTEYNFVQRQSQRALSLEEKGVISKIEADKVRTALEKATLGIKNAEAKLVEEKEKLGIQGDENPRIRAALAALQKAQLDLNRTTIYAPSLGGVSNLSIDIGHYASVGQPVMTFISTNAVWVEAYMRENCLENIKKGNEVEMVLDAAPGRVFKGTIIGAGYGVDWGKTAKAGQLPSVSSPKGWLRDPQRFPVLVQFSDESSKGMRRIGGQADVVVYTEEGFIMNALGSLLIRLMSILSYLH
ncbi:HlyD family secretion protein [Oceanicoccus sagamiensis]|uniref:Uncharacterized protein n=1 Tax=Oceanicoccus sagamiensis TaxID=716816 RepID=A0A1X9NCQ2_9GAMM|nr:HlyD family secretion protein [Oceanicoccus sagamiensis]ARN74824.1 hypothetical protein BST96_12270 [Oceanicoccus sagamiensis]